MTLSESESSLYLSWPYTQSPLDGPLYTELTQWGYLDDADVHMQNDAHCDFDNWHRVKTAFGALGIDTRSKGMGGPNECWFVQHANGFGVKAGARGEMPVPAEQRYVVAGREYKVTEGYSRIGINRASGIVYFLHRKSPAKSAAELWNVPEESIRQDDLPKIQKSSDLAWAFWNRAKGGDIKHITKFMVMGVVNDEAAHVIIPRALSAVGVHDVLPWPGTDIIVGLDGQEDAAMALIGSPNGLGAGYFLLQHKRQLGGAKFIWKIKIFKGEDEFESDPNLIFYVDPNAPPVPPKEGAPETLTKNKVPHVVKRSRDGRSVVREHVLGVKV
ncbi:Mitochondrial import inner membrane translocase subunit tim8 [Coniothyrium glycines]